MGFSFIHASDLHLDSPFSCLSSDLPLELSDTIIDAQFKVLRRIMDLAVDSSCSFVCLSGDIFDTNEFSISARMRFLNEVSRIAGHGIKTFLVLGNHDPVDTSALSLAHFDAPKDALYVFPPEEPQGIAIKTKDGQECMVSGISFREKKETRNLALYFKDLKVPPHMVSIGLLHTNCGGISGHGNYAPCTISDLALSTVDYWALGHVHRYRQLRPQHPTILYPGIIQGRHFGENGPKGCILVEVKEGPTFKHSFIPMDVVRWACIDIWIEKFHTLDELYHEILKSMKKNTKGEVDRPRKARPPVKFNLVRLNLKGKARLKKITYRDELLKDLKDSLNTALFEELGIWVDEIKDLTSSEREHPIKRPSKDLVSKILSTTERFKEDQRLKKRLLKEIETLFRRREISRALTLPDETAIPDLISQSRDLLLELMEDDDSTR